MVPSRLHDQHLCLGIVGRPNAISQRWTSMRASNLTAKGKVASPAALEVLVFETLY